MTVTEPIQLEPFQTHGAAVRARLLAMISEGELRPGQAFSLREMAARLGVSITPVRDAVNLLHQQGFLGRGPRRSCRIIGITPERVRGYWVVRRALLAESAREAAAKLTDSDIAELDRLAARVDALIDMEHYEDAGPLESQFHTRIALIARLPFLAREIERLDQYDIIIHGPILPLKAHQHAALVEALATRDPSVAERAMREHVNLGLAHTLATLAARGTTDATDEQEDPAGRRTGTESVPARK